MAMGRRDPRRERFWRGVLARQRKSGLSVRAFCAAHGLAETALYAWRRILRDRDCEEQPGPDAARSPILGTAPTAVPAARDLITSPVTVPAFVPVVVRKTDREAAAADFRAGTSSTALVPPHGDAEMRRVATAGDSIDIEMRGGRVLRLPASMSPGRLAAVVHAIESIEAVDAAESLPVRDGRGEDGNGEDVA